MSKRTKEQILDELTELLDSDPALRGRALTWLEEQADAEEAGNVPATGFIPIRRVAEELEINEQTVRLWIRNGKLPAFKIGRKVFVRPGDLRALAEPWEPGEQIGATAAA
ncbi:MAG: hypothetical protein COZ06_03835 [Armatimonadetes bacterium CG_4_10_14_3_um_filter_66_18]|nr:MAG: hypothetical protein COZ06_03835 [Armatimonadetes bacterium CG_4_10_14_3_um_filter_66_18]